MAQARGSADSQPARRAASGHLRVLIVEDEPALLRALQINLRARGYDVATAAAGGEALAEARRQAPDAVLLDLGLPDIDGTEVIRELRGWSGAPVIVLSGRAGSGDKIGALDAGADDYVTKPFDIEELLARLRAALRRGEEPAASASFRIGQYEIDVGAHTIVHDVQSAPEAASAGAAQRMTGTTSTGGAQASAGHEPSVPGQQLHLTPTEWRLLEVLLAAPGQLVGSERLLGEVWGPGFEHSTHYLRFHMAGLRRKLEDDPHRPRHLLTEPGMGYRYQP
jgi:two-component system, OmpR family, KDP operon response regulator KdpE